MRLLKSLLIIAVSIVLLFDSHALFLYAENTEQGQQADGSATEIESPSTDTDTNKEADSEDNDNADKGDAQSLNNAPNESNDADNTEQDSEKERGSKKLGNLKPKDLVEVSQVPLVITVDDDSNNSSDDYYDVVIRFKAKSGSDPISPEAWIKLDFAGYKPEYESPGVLKCQIRQEETIEIPNLDVGQEYSVTVSGKKGKQVVSEYMCAGGRVKSNVTQGETENTVSCTIRSGSDEDKEQVTDPTMINRVKIHFRSLEAGTGEVPYRINARFAKGHIAQSCGISNYHTEYIWFHAESEDVWVSDISELLEFRPGPAGASDTKLIEYAGRNVTYKDGGTEDIFSVEGRYDISPLLERPLGDEDANRTVVIGNWNGPIYEIRITVPADTKKEPSYEIWRIGDNDGNQITPAKVDKMELEYNMGGETTSVRIENDTPSSVQESFDYVLTLHLPEAYKDNQYEVRHFGGDFNETTLQPIRNETEYQFNLKSKEFIVVADLPSETTYDIKQLDNHEYVTSARNGDVGSDIGIKVESVSEGHIVKNRTLFEDAEFIYHGERFPMYDGVPPKCPPRPPGNYTTPLIWNNLPKSNFKINIQKKSEGVANPNLSLEGAEFGMYSRNAGILYSSSTNENGLATFDGVSQNETYLLAETKAPKGYDLANTIWVLSKDEMDENSLRNFVLSNRYRLGIEMTGQEIKWIQLNPDSDDPITIDATEPLLTTTLDLRKYLLTDESKYDGPMFEFLTFRMPEQTTAYRDSLWPRSYFEDMEGVEFKLTLDSDPNNPRFTYTAVTGENGRTRFKRVLGVQDGETEEDLYKIQYGKYTLKETKAPAGIKKMEDQHISITPQKYSPFGNNDPNPYQADVVRVVNVPEKEEPDGSVGEKNQTDIKPDNDSDVVNDDAVTTKDKGRRASTGDDSVLWGAAALCMMTLATLIAMIIRRRKQKN